MDAKKFLKFLYYLKKIIIHKIIRKILKRKENL